MNVIINLIITVLVFVFAKWLVELVGLYTPWSVLVALLCACLAFWSDPYARFRR